ncbi:MAG: DNA translocase FtsK 4TM domain-containing protein [Methylococcales bacterium]|nr:DNA translocase FtsK 4TM domain-containing protein [Methylococcales bacterium]
MSAVMEEKTFRGLREVTALVFFACALFFLIALVTFSNEDAGWTHSGTVRNVTNACGVFGAWLADFSLSFFGLCAYLFPVIIFWHGYLFNRHRNVTKSQEKIFMALAWLGSIAAIISSTALLHLYVLRIGIELPRSTGGIVGEEIGGAAFITLGNSGATLFLLVLLVAGITMITDLSWVKLMDMIGKYTVSCCQILFRQAFDWQAKTTLENTVRIPVVPKKVNTRKNPIIGVVPTIETTVAKVVARVEKSSSPAKKLPPTKRYKSGETVLPSLDLLDNREIRVIGYSQADLEAMSRLVETILADFNVIVNVVDFHPGPVITRFELQPAAGVKVSRISSLSKDLARALSVTSVRIVEIIPGKTVVGLEIPNREREMVTLRELLVSPNFIKAKSLLTLAMGKDIAGAPMVADLGKMPHALVAGTTGSGKSVAINTMILSLLYKATPEQVRMIMIDPKMLELSVYEGIPHLLTPVVTDMKEASNALRWAVGEMERRYKLMSKMGVRNLAGFNTLIEEATARGESIPDPMYQILNPFAEGEIPALATLPSIVIVIDELADMMMIVGKKVEELIARLAQKARAAGIHLVLATQRPSVDVLTGLIKANVPTRISFQVSSRIDSRTILDQGGAETLLGNGDMLFLPSGTSIPIRAHGAFVDDHEVHRVVEFLKQTAPPDYLEEITRESFDNDSFSMGGSDSSGGGSETDALYDEAVRFVTESRKASISSVQRRFKVGYNRAATMIEDMEAAGVVSSAESNGSRVVLAPSPVRD